MDTLLVIDDEQAFGDFVSKVGVAAGFTVVVTDQPEEFFEHLRMEPSVVMLDMQMPQMDGIELLREMASRKCSSKVLVASGLDMRTIDTVHRLGRELGLGMEGALRKPVRAAELRELLTRLKGCRFEPTAEGLKRAIAKDELFALFQPKVAIPTKRCVGVEMLLRWKEPGGTLVSPDQIVPLAEQEGLIDALTDWVLRHGIAQAGEWQRMGLDLKLSVNVSASNLHDVTLPDRIEAMCRSAGLSATQLVVELTETATMRDATRLMEVLARLRIKGAELSIDDFGTGYSSLVQLHRLPFTELKIDKSFVTTMDRETEVIANAITQLGHALGLTVTAEGVETQAVFERLAELGVDQAQGYLLSRPIPAADIPGFVHASRR